MINDYKLVKLVEEHEVLYNRRHPHYKIMDKKEEAFVEIAAGLGITDVHLVINRYRTLRDRYARYKRIKETTGEIRFYLPILDKMEFLGPHIFNKKKDRKTNSCDSDDSQDPLHVEASETLDEAPSATQIERTEQAEGRGFKRKSEHAGGHKINKARFVKSANELNETINSFLMISQAKTEKQNSGALHGFRQMIITTIGQMDVTKQTKAMLGVTEAVMKIKMEDED
uniref:MADF domain-containing protein n=1 Tax=Stomoxys calcitrans TaxID=35570 RepID=A0A1I8NVI3_STOCA